MLCILCFAFSLLHNIINSSSTLSFSHTSGHIAPFLIDSNHPQLLDQLETLDEQAVEINKLEHEDKVVRRQLQR